MVPPNEYARAVVPHGTTTVVADPHEIANVLGLEGIRYMLDMAKYNPLSVYVMAPSCVPSTDMETTGAALYWYDLQTLLHEPYVLGLGEMMNFPGVINGAPDVLDSLRAFQGRVKDGHAPGLTGKELMAYAAANIGSDHECTTAEEAHEKLELGMFIFLREATNARNLRDLLPVVNEHTNRRLCFCTDDRVPADLMDEGHIDYMVRAGHRRRRRPVTVIRMATLNASEYFQLHDRGADGPGPARRPGGLLRPAGTPRRDGLSQRQTGRATTARSSPGCARKPRPVLRSSVNINWARIDLRVPADGRRVRVIGLIPDQVGHRAT